MKNTTPVSKAPIEERLKSFEDVHINSGERNPEALDEFILLLEDNYVDSDEAFKYVLKRRLAKVISIIIGVILNVIGFAMILIPYRQNLRMLFCSELHRRTDFIYQMYLALLKLSVLV
jgi:hypothetical protein